ncbi:GntR family transcriptional regulator [Propylenella binzhouense]|uniref:GntR family transcriptional regulator n=1 Tax=Propylenella binzhouense TaxID=2555902 RepID=A0A964T872_9HYPH|nr:GntR family transcriptional regulator [Propylenella binzhouense]MYZ50308.1 GntR family transcriptional regulator [Propylenella binzhouense]
MEEGPTSAGGVYDAVKQLILSGSYRPGNKLVHEELAGRLNVSRTPVREALERLRQEGYVRHVPRRGFFVSEIGEAEARDLYGVREALELHALRTIFAEAGKVETAPLRAINLRYRQAVTDRTAKTRLQVDAEFHLALAGQAGNSHLVQLLAGIFERIALKMRTETYELRLGEEAVAEHEALLDAFERGDPQQADERLRAHIGSARARLLRQMEDWT